MVDVLQGNAGWVQQLFLWALVLYPVLTVPVVLYAFLGGRGEEPAPRPQPYAPPSQEELWRLQHSHRPEAAWMPEGAHPAIRRVEAREGITLDQLLDVLEAASKIERVEPRSFHRREVRDPGQRPGRALQSIEDDRPVSIPPRAPAPPVEPPPRVEGPETLGDARTLRAARRVAANPKMQGWIRDVARELLQRTGTDS